VLTDMAVTPLVSVVCPSFNHGRHMPAFVQSILAQSEVRWELIIIDDCSTDDNVAQARKFADPRIRIIERAYNRGVAAGMNEGVALANAEIIAFLASDDLARPDYLKNVVAALMSDSAKVAAYVELDQIDEGGTPLGRRTSLPANLDRYRLLKASFLGQNPLPSPGMAVRRGVARSLRVPEGVVQFSDWLWHNQILLAGEVVLLGEPLIQYRVSPRSLSARSIGSMARDQLETRTMMDEFLGLKDMAFLRQVFPEETKPYASLPAVHIPYVLGRMALLSDIHEKRCWGYETIMRHLSEPSMAESLRRHAGFAQKDLMGLVPTEAAGRMDEIRRLRRRLRHLRRWIIVLAAGLTFALWAFLR